MRDSGTLKKTVHLSRIRHKCFQFFQALQKVIAKTEEPKIDLSRIDPVLLKTAKAFQLDGIRLIKNSNKVTLES